mmetsp:Transcript_91465/g.290019  ORF Transcript_91465/g.290019 Transcript_91465/m.290019 type:complete len:114 (-) Transcript_91465:224-565(-)
MACSGGEESLSRAGEADLPADPFEPPRPCESLDNPSAATGLEDLEGESEVLASSSSLIVLTNWLARPSRKVSSRLPADMPRTLPRVVPTTAMVSPALVRLSACRSRPLRKRKG